MAFKLTKQEISQRNKIIDDLAGAYAKLEDEVNFYNAAVAQLRDPVEGALAEYNEVVAEASNFCDDIASRLDSEFDDKSEKWQEGDRGEAAAEMRDQWQNIIIDEIEVSWPDDLEIDAPGHAEELDGLPAEAE